MPKVTIRALIAIACGALALVLLAAHAHADTGATDVVIDGSRAVAWWRNGQFLLVGIIVVFVALRAAHQRIPWLAAGNRGVYVAAALAGLAVIVEAANRGTTPSIDLIVTAVGAALALLIKTPPPPAAPPPGDGLPPKAEST